MIKRLTSHGVTLSACLLSVTALSLVAVEASAGTWHPYFNVCQVTAAPGPNEGSRSAMCQYLAPPGTPFSQGEYVAQLTVHTVANAPKNTHDWARLPNRNGWNWMYSNNKLGTYCPQVNVKALCSKSQGTWNSPLTYSQGWWTLGSSYVLFNGSADTPNLFCPSDRPYMLNGNADTQMFW